MKKFTKISLFTSLILILIGGTICVIGAVSGGWKLVREIEGNGRWWQMIDKVSDDGWDPTRDKATTIRYLGVYYLNPDGTFVLVWEHPDAEEIIERTGTELLPLNEYITPRRGR